MSIFSSLSKSLNRPIGIDLGTARTRIWAESKGLLLDQPSVIAVDQSNQKVVAVGEAAAKMRGRVEEGSVLVYQPVQTPKLTDRHQLKAMLRLFLAQVSDQVYFFSPTMVVALPGSFYPSMKEVLVEVLVELGAGQVILVDQCLAAALGAGVPISDASGSFVMQLGAGVVEVAGLSLAKVVGLTHTLKAGNYVCEELEYWFATEQKLKISASIAERVLCQAGSLVPDAKRSINVTGLDVKSGEPREQIILAEELLELFGGFGQEYAQLVKNLLAQTPPDLTVDIIDKGLLLAGGLAQLSGLEEFLSEQLRLPVFLIDEPQQAVIAGVGVILEHLNEFKQSVGY